MPEFQIRTVGERPYLYAEKTSGMAPDAISAAMGEAFRQVFDFMQKNGIAPAGPALSVYHDFAMGETMTFRAGFEVARADMAKAAGEIRADVTPAGKVLFFAHTGSYATLRDDYDLMMAHAGATRLELGPPSWELYLNDPDQVPEDELITECHVSLADPG